MGEASAVRESRAAVETKKMVEPSLETLRTSAALGSSGPLLSLLCWFLKCVVWLVDKVKLYIFCVLTLTGSETDGYKQILANP